MFVELLYFGMIAEKTGKGSESFQFSETPTGKALREELTRTYTSLEGISFRIAVDQELLHDENERIPKGAEVALLPAFAGG